ncbi:hypothetical protein [Clostridium botulinum]|uniref:hypothetical protein n=1 Tax=Clostridium botulinum TaxID=1491 RepID=UPI0002DF87C5|nr:hypothetical protein [Clostridium botulinum]
MKKFLKHLLLSLLLFIPFMVSKATVSFAYVDDHIQNNTKDTAYELKENTLQDVLSQYNRRVFNCFLENSNDIGWFKTYLSNGDKTLTINIDVNSTIEVISEKDDKVVFTRKYGRSIAKQGEFKITENGVYYIKVKPNEEVNKIQNFTMLVGEPDYSRKYFTKILTKNYI